MDIEFHYYMTYLIAAKAGFGPEDALIIAHSSQYVDDNDMRFTIDKEKPSAYSNYISQTMNILKPRAKLFRIYILFHFIPGDPLSPGAQRRDGKMHWLNTTPGSKNAELIMESALSSGDLYRIGIAAHAYADTWAHQNFIGYYDEFNAMERPLSRLIPNIGHADALHNPDWPALVWRDARLIDERRDNKAIFLESAGALFERLFRFTDPAAGVKAIKARKKELICDLDQAIGERDQANAKKDERMARFAELASDKEYGGKGIADYDPDAWVDEALKEDVRGMRDRSDFTLARWDPLKDSYSWAHPDSFMHSHWFRFQGAVKAHQAEALDILSRTHLNNLDLPRV